MIERLQQFWSNDQGQDIAEYALMLAVVAIVVIVTVQQIGTNAQKLFSEVASLLD